MKGSELGDKVVEKYELGKEQERSRIAYIIMEYKNPYPKDIFKWDNKEKTDFTRGCFNEFVFNIVENFRRDLLKLIKEDDL